MFKMLERGNSKAGGAFARSWSPYYFLSFCSCSLAACQPRLRSCYSLDRHSIGIAALVFHIPALVDQAYQWITRVQSDLQSKNEAHEPRCERIQERNVA